MRIRDGLSGLAYLRARKDIDPDRIIIGGHGMGGIVALHVAAIDGKTAGVFANELLASFDLLATAESYAWSHEDFLPNVIKFYDIPDLVAALSMPTMLINPLDAAKRPLSTDRAKVVYSAALKNGKRFQLHAAIDPGHGNQPPHVLLNRGRKDEPLRKKSCAEGYSSQRKQEKQHADCRRGVVEDQPLKGIDMIAALNPLHHVDNQKYANVHHRVNQYIQAGGVKTRRSDDPAASGRPSEMVVSRSRETHDNESKLNRSRIRE